MPDARDICRRVSPALILHSKRDTYIPRVSLLHASVVVDARLYPTPSPNNFLSIQFPATKRIIHTYIYIYIYIYIYTKRAVSYPLVHIKNYFLSRYWSLLLRSRYIYTCNRFEAIAPVLISRWPPWERFISRRFTFLYFYTYEILQLVRHGGERKYRRRLHFASRRARYTT